MIFLELTGIAFVWRDHPFRGGASQILMRVMDPEADCREELRFPCAEVTAEPHRCLRKQRGGTYWHAAGIWLSKELGWPQKGLR